MFVSRSEPAEGKRNLEIYSDPRNPFFYVITGSPNAIDKFVGTTVANYLQGAAAKAALKQPDSTLKIVIGGSEYWPIGSNSAKPQDIYYYGPNGEVLSQKIWGILSDGAGRIGPFVEPGGSAIQCGKFDNSDYWLNIIPDLSQKDPAGAEHVANGLIATSIRYCGAYNPEGKMTGSGIFGTELVNPIAKPEIIDLK